MILDAAFAAGTAILVFALIMLERHRPARAFPATRGWTVMGALFLAVSLPVGAGAALVLPLDVLTAHALVTLEPWPLSLELCVGFLCSTLAYYWLHRAQHHIGWLWRSGHQLHHAIPRVDLAGTAFLHPTDLFLQIAINVIVCAFVLGLSDQATAAVGIAATVCGFLQHLNLKTPSWLVLFVQRPEAHCVHHQTGVHAFNYSDFPLWDFVFGTLRNPAHWSGSAGFGAPLDIGALLLMRDVSASAPDALA